LVELLKVSVSHSKGFQFQSWCGLMENNSDQNSYLLEHLLAVIQAPDFIKLFPSLYHNQLEIFSTMKKWLLW
jgi:hypothetical protein